MQDFIRIGQRLREFQEETHGRAFHFTQVGQEDAQIKQQRIEYSETSGISLGDCHWYNSINRRPSDKTESLQTSLFIHHAPSFCIV